MKFVVLDFETYYSADYTLTKMSTEDYVNDPRFEIILVGIKIGTAAPYYITGTKEQIGQHLHSLNLHECVVCAHNIMFDALILAVHFGIVPHMYCDTMMLAQAQLKPYSRSISLKNCLLHLNLGVEKGDYVNQMKGRTRQTLSKHEMQEYGTYCTDDCLGEFALFQYFAPQFPRNEFQIMDATTRMYTQPQLELDANLLAALLNEVRAKKAQALATANVTTDKLMSNPKFAELLMSFGIEPPTKISPTTGLVTYAFNKTDTGWKELEEEWEDDPAVSAILAARISAKSTLEETRLVRLLEIAKKYGKFRIPIRYHAAHTGRDGGTESLNAQNFPRIDKSRMRFAIRAPKGHVIVAADLSQIEARITAYLAKQRNLLDGFRQKADNYSLFASQAFGIPTVKDRSPADNKRRFVGKTCILGLGFGMSDTRLRGTLRKDGVKLTIPECMNLVSAYRTMYSQIPAMWRALDQMLPLMAGGGARFKFGPCVLTKNAVILPNGMALVYHNLRHHETEKYSGWVYSFAGETRTLWGGKLTENIVQALARILVMDYMLQIKHTIRIYPVLRQHDELDYVVPTKYADKVVAVLRKIMTVPPTWAPDLPIDVDIHYGPTLGDCK